MIGMTSTHFSGMFTEQIFWFRRSVFQVNLIGKEH